MGETSSATRSRWATTPSMPRPAPPTAPSTTSRPRSPGTDDRRARRPGIGFAVGLVTRSGRGTMAMAPPRAPTAAVTNGERWAPARRAAFAAARGSSSPSPSLRPGRAHRLDRRRARRHRRSSSPLAARWWWRSSSTSPAMPPRTPGRPARCRPRSLMPLARPPRRGRRRERRRRRRPPARPPADGGHRPGRLRPGAAPAQALRHRPREPPCQTRSRPNATALSWRCRAG